MTFGKQRLFGSEVERIIGRAHEFDLYRPTWAVIDQYVYSRKASWYIYYGLYGFIQPRFTIDERFEIKGISELGNLTGHFKQSYTTAQGTVSVTVGDKIKYDSRMWKVATILEHKDARGQGITRAQLDPEVE